jgi:hypothetical protein
MENGGKQRVRRMENGGKAEDGEFWRIELDEFFFQKIDFCSSIYI